MQSSQVTLIVIGPLSSPLKFHILQPLVSTMNWMALAVQYHVSTTNRQQWGVFLIVAGLLRDCWPSRVLGRVGVDLQSGPDVNVLFIALQLIQHNILATFQFSLDFYAYLD